ncbi:hypothetical protein WN943_027735 [Citrus x changshan-huyou]
MIKRLIIINYLNGKITYGVYNFNFYNTFPMGGHTSKTSFSYYLLLYNLPSLYFFIFVLKYTLIIVIIFFFLGLVSSIVITGRDLLSTKLSVFAITRTEEVRTRTKPFSCSSHFLPPTL